MREAGRASPSVRPTDGRMLFSGDRRLAPKYGAIIWAAVRRRHRRPDCGSENTVASGAPPLYDGTYLGRIKIMATRVLYIISDLNRVGF